MRITALRIEDFRSIKQLQLELGESTVFVGPNNAGKTAILDALRIVGLPIIPSALRIKHFARVSTHGERDPTWASAAGWRLRSPRVDATLLHDSAEMRF